MHQEPVSPDPGPSCPDWMDDPAYLAMRAEDEDPGDLDLDDPHAIMRLEREVTALRNRGGPQASVEALESVQLSEADRGYMIVEGSADPPTQP
jgi:hypothetical protein